MEYLLFFGSIAISLTMIVVFRNLDKNNKTFEKVARLLKSVKEDINQMTSDKIQEIKDYNNFIETSLSKGEMLLSDLNKNLKLTEQKNTLLQNDKVVSLLQKVENIESKFDNINTQLNELNETKDFSKNSTKFIKENMNEMKNIKNDILSLKKELDTKKNSVTDAIKKEENTFFNSLEKNKKTLLETLNKEKKHFDDNLAIYKRDLEGINSLISSMKTNFMKEVEDGFDSINQNYKTKSDVVKKEFSDLEVELRKKLEDKIGDYSRYIVRIEERSENLTKKLEKELNSAKDNYVLDLKENFTKILGEFNKHNEQLRAQSKNEIANQYSNYENHYKKLIDSLKSASENANSKIGVYESFLKDSFEKFEKYKKNTFTDIDSRIGEFNIHINNAKDLGIKLELQIFNEIKEKLNSFKNEIENSIDKSKTEINSRVDDYQSEVNNRHGLTTNTLKEMGEDLKKFNDFFEDELNRYKDSFIKLESDKNSFGENFNNWLIGLKNDLDKEIAKNGSIFKDSEEKLKNDMSKLIVQLDKDRDEHKKKSIEDMEKYKNIFNTNMVKMKHYFEKENEKVFANIDRMVSQVVNKADGKTDELTNRFEFKYKEVESRLMSVTDMMQEKSLELENNIIKKSNDIEEKIDNKMKDIIQNLYAKQDEFENEIKNIGNNYEIKLKDFTNEINTIIKSGKASAEQKIESINSKVMDFGGVLTNFVSDMDQKIKDTNVDYEKFVADIHNKVFLVEKNFEDRTLNIEKSYFIKGEEFLNIQKERLEGFIDKFDILTANLDQLKSIIDNEVSQKIDDGKNSIESSYRELENETINKIEEYKNELNKVRQNMKFLDEKFSKRFDDKLLDFDNKFLNKMEMFNQKYKTNIDEMFEKSEQLEVRLSNRVNEIDDNYFKKGETLLNENKLKFGEFINHFKSLNSEIASLKQKIDTDILEKINDGKNNLDEQYRLLEGETLKKINDYKNELLKIRQNMQQLDEKFILKFNEKVNDVDHKLDLKIQDLDKKMENEKFEMSKKTEEMLNESKQKLDLFKRDFDGLKEDINLLKSQIDGDITKKIDDGKDEINRIYQNEIDKLMDKYKVNEEMVINKLNDYKKDINKVEQNMKQIDDRFTARFLEHSSNLDKKIGVIEDDIKRFEKSTGIFEKFDYMKEKLNDELTILKNSLSEIKQEKGNILEIEKRMILINATIKESDQKINQFLNDKKKIDNLTSMISTLKTQADSAEEKIASIESARILINGLDSKINNIEVKLRGLEDIYKDASDKEVEIKRSIESVNDIKNRSLELSKYLEVINKKYDDLEFKRTTYEKTFKNFEKDAGFIIKSEGKINDVLDKFNQMDGLVEDIEQRTDSINKIREWLVKAETQIVNLNNETDKRIKLLESLFDRSPESKVVKNSLKDDTSKKDAVMKLKNHGWTIDDIAKNLNLSIGEVEFILDLEYHRGK